MVSLATFHKVTITRLPLLSPLGGSWVIQLCAGELGSLCSELVLSTSRSLKAQTIPPVGCGCSQSLKHAFGLLCCHASFYFFLLCLVWSFPCLILFWIVPRHPIDLLQTRPGVFRAPQSSLKESFLHSPHLGDREMIEAFALEESSLG